MPYPHLSETEILPRDGFAGALAARVFRPDLGGPAVAAVRADGVFDVTPTFATMRDLAEQAKPAAALRAAAGARIGGLSELLANAQPDERDPRRPWLLAPVDLQAIKAAGVTFATSMLERVIEERARGNPDSAARIRAEMGRLIGEDLRTLKPGSAAAERLKAALIAEGRVVAISRSRHRPRRRDFHEGAADVGGRLRRRRGVSRRIRTGTTRSRRRC